MTMCLLACIHMCVCGCAAVEKGRMWLYVCVCMCHEVDQHYPGDNQEGWRSSSTCVYLCDYIVRMSTTCTCVRKGCVGVLCVKDVRWSKKLPLVCFLLLLRRSIYSLGEPRPEVASFQATTRLSTAGQQSSTIMHTEIWRERERVRERERESKREREREREWEREND